jgi:GNAT superfamily N-acetyltransferase
MEGIRLRVGPWATLGDACRIVRDDVGDASAPLDDAEDNVALHVLAVAAGEAPVGAGRLLPDGRIDRLAVRKERRRGGVGTAILALLVEEAREQGLAEVTLNVPLGALPFFRQFDDAFETVGDPFVTAGAKHQALRLRLQP